MTPSPTTTEPRQVSDKGSSKSPLEKLAEECDVPVTTLWNLGIDIYGPNKSQALVPLVDPLTGKCSEVHQNGFRYPNGQRWPLKKTVDGGGGDTTFGHIGNHGERPRVTMVEGIKDFVTVCEWSERNGGPAIIGLPGATSAAKFVEMLSPHVESIVMCLDNDEPKGPHKKRAGTEAMKAAAEAWAQLPPDKQCHLAAVTGLKSAGLKDVTNYREANGWDGLETLFNTYTIFSADTPVGQSDEAAGEQSDDKESSRRKKQQRNTKARASAIDRVADDGRRMFLERRIWEYKASGGWVHVSEPVARNLIVTELAKDFGVQPQGVTPRLTSDTLQSFKDTCQPPAAHAIELAQTNKACDLKSGAVIEGTPWLDVMLRVTDSGDVQTLRRDRDVWCQRPPIPVEWDDGSHSPPGATLEWLRRATTAIDDDMNSPEAHARANWLMVAIGQVLAERAQDQKMWVLHGEGRRGKGTFLRLLGELVGGSVFECAAPGELADRFAMSALETNRVLALADAPAVDLKDRDTRTGVARMKCVSGGDKVRCEIKNGPARSLLLQTIIFVASNELPAWSSSAADLEAWSGRFRVTDWCGPRPPVEIADFHLRLIQRDGLANIARCAIDAYRRSRSGDLTEPPEWTALKEQILRGGLDPLEQWASECLSRSTRSVTPVDELTAHAREWCERRDLHEDTEITRQSVGAAISKKFRTARSKQKKVAGRVIRVWPVVVADTREVTAVTPHVSLGENLALKRTSGGNPREAVTAVTSAAGELF